MLLNKLEQVELIREIIHRLGSAISTVPSTEAWLYAATLALIFTIIALPIGFFGKFLQIEVVNVPWKVIIGIITMSFLTPAITEELFFRVLLLPPILENGAVSIGLCCWGGISLVLFIVYHPLNAISFFPRGRNTFFNLVFLVLAALLGIVCSLSYIQSHSLWTAVTIHWLAVVIWLLFLGGYRKLYV